MSAISEASRETKVPERILAALIAAESSFNPSAVSKAGAVGLTQLMPETAKALGVDPHNLRENVVGGARYLAQMIHRYNGNLPLALAAYNAGPGAVTNHVPDNGETLQYVTRIMQSLGYGRG